jgi:lipoprotein-releasing system ATP-binding protein
MSQPLLSATGISHSFDTELFSNVNFTLTPAESAAIVGRSGSGKSTLLHIFSTFIEPNVGKVSLFNTDIYSLKDRDIEALRRYDIGIIFQFHYLIQGLTALENVMVPGLIARKNKKTIEKAGLNVLERVGLGNRVFHRAEDLSGGEQQRVALARALVMNPEVLLADEPTGNLDQKSSRSVHELINELNKELGMTVIVVTHNNDLAGKMEKNVSLMDGKIIPV